MDLTAISQSGWSASGVAVKTGLLLRIFSGLDFNPKFTNGYHIGQALRYYIESNSEWKRELEKYNLRWTNDYNRTSHQEEFNKAVDDWVFLES